VTVLYHVAVDATTGTTVVYDSATIVAGAPATSRTTHDGFVVRFGTTNVSVTVELQKNADGTTYSLKVDARSGNCGQGMGHGKGHGATFGQGESSGHGASFGHGAGQAQVSAHSNGKQH
jgi:hypothetical protein